MNGSFDTNRGAAGSRSLSLFVTLCLLASLASAVYGDDTGERPMTLFSLHRGALEFAPENTYAAFDKAIELGADYVEFDVRTTSDGHHVLLHDGNLDRTTDGTGPVEEATLQEIESLDAGSWFGEEFAGARVPILDEFLKRYTGKVGFYFDAKEITPEALASALERQDAVESTVVYGGAEFLAKLKEANPNVKRMPGLGDPDDIARIVDLVDPYAFDARWNVLSEELIARCHALGIKVFSDAMGADTAESHLQAMRWGIDLIQTDRALEFLEAARRYRNER